MILAVRRCSLIQIPTSANYKKDLARAFPAERFRGLVAAHDCKECDEIRAKFSNRAWTDISTVDLAEYDDVLPLLTPEAYCAFLPAWIYQALDDPEGGPATMALINMENSEHVVSFSHAQRSILIECVQWIHQADPFRTQDEESTGELTNLVKRWQP